MSLNYFEYFINIEDENLNSIFRLILYISVFHIWNISSSFSNWKFVPILKVLISVFICLSLIISWISVLFEFPELQRLFINLVWTNKDKIQFRIFNPCWHFKNLRHLHPLLIWYFYTLAKFTIRVISTITW